MPIYVYRCERCGETFEELQKMDEGAPPSPSDGCPSGASTCPLSRELTTATHRFTADYSSDGRGGYTRQGDAMIRQVTGKNSATYGSDRSGRG